MKRLYTALFSFFIMGFIFFVVFSFSMKYIKIVEAKSKISDIQQKIEKLKNENRDLSEKVKLLKIPSYIEKVAREELGLVKPGEILFLPRIR